MSEENNIVEEIENNTPEVIENVENDNPEVIEKPVEEVYKPWKAEKKLPETVPYNRFSEVVYEKNMEMQRRFELEKELAKYNNVQETVKKITKIEDIDMDQPIPVYHEQLVTFITNQLEEKHRIEREQEKFQEIQSKKLQNFSTRMSEAIKENPEVSEAAKHVGQYVDQIPAYIQDSIVEDDNGPWLLWELATQKGLIEELSKMTPTESLRKIGRISAKYDNRNFQKESPKEVTKEPVKDIPVMQTKSAGSPNIRSTSTNSTNYSNAALSKMSTKEYMEWRRKQR